MNHNDMVRSLQSDLTQYAIAEIKGMVARIDKYEGPGNGILRLSIVAHMNGRDHNHTVSLFDDAAANDADIIVGDVVFAMGALTNTYNQQRDTWYTAVEVHDPKYVVVVKKATPERSAAIASAMEARRNARQGNTTSAPAPAARTPRRQPQTASRPAPQETPPAAEPGNFDDDIPF